MPFHPRVEFALNRISILGASATDELALLNHDDLEDMLHLSVVSIADPKKFKRQLRRDDIRDIKVKISQSTDDEMMTEQFNKRLQQLEQEQEQEDEEEAQQQQQQGEGEDEDEESKVEVEVRRMKKELHQMSLVLLDSIRMSIELAPTKQNEEEQKQDQQQETEAEEPALRICNVSLLRFVFTILSDTGVATALRIPLLQGDLPLLARGVLRCCCAADENKDNSSSSPEAKLFSQFRNTLIFLALDMCATMCADSAACRLAFACCVPFVASVLKSFVKAAAAPVLTPLQRPNSASTSNATAKKAPVTFVRPQQAQQQQEQENATSSATTSDDDVIFAGSAALESLLFHCPDAIEAFVDADGIRILVSLYKQLQQDKEKTVAEKKNKDNGGGGGGGGATDTTAFIKRVLIHIRTCGVIEEAKWKELLGGGGGAGAGNVFGRQGDCIAVDELRWALSGGVKLGRVKA